MSHEMLLNHMDDDTCILGCSCGWEADFPFPDEFTADIAFDEHKEQEQVWPPYWY